MLRIDDISYSIQGRPLFEGASATIPEGHKVGLVGPPTRTASPKSRPG
jgi:ATP-binding cassette subfamily F protein 3